MATKMMKTLSPTLPTAIFCLKQHKQAGKLFLAADILLLRKI